MSEVWAVEQNPRMKSSLVASIVIGCVVIGGVLGWALTAYWWNFGPDEHGPFPAFITPFYVALGGFLVLLASGVALGVVEVLLGLRRRP